MAMGGLGRTYGIIERLSTLMGNDERRVVAKKATYMIHRRMESDPSFGWDTIMKLTVLMIEVLVVFYLHSTATTGIASPRHGISISRLVSPLTNIGPERQK